MNFYGIDYLKDQTNYNDYLKYVIIFCSLIIVLLLFSMYIRHRLNTKYRDLSIIFLLVLLLALGIQYSDYQTNQTRHSQSSQMVSFIDNLAAEQNVNTSELYVNATQFSDGIIVTFNNKFYKVGLNADQNSYTLTETYLMNNQVKYMN